MIKIQKLTKKFGEKKVLDDVSLEIKDKGVVGLLGPNGAGKTTLMRLLVGFYPLEGGKILWNKEEIDTKDTEYRQIIGYLPENNPLYPSMLVKEYLNFVAEIKEVESIDEVVKDCGVDNVLNQKCETLSKGYKQRVGLAAALIGKPKLLVLDEPTSGLDPNQIIEIRKLIKKLAKDRIVLLSTHILPEAQAICDHLFIINRGKIVLDEETKKIKNLEKKFVEMTV